MTKLVTVGIGGSSEIAAAAANTVHRMLRVVGGAGITGCTFKSASDAITPTFLSPAAGVLDVAFPNGNVQTAEGEALNLVCTGASGGTFWVEYDSREVTP